MTPRDNAKPTPHPKTVSVLSIEVFLLTQYESAGCNTRSSPTLPVSRPCSSDQFVLVRFGSAALRELREAVFGTVTVRAMRRLSLTLLDHLLGLDLEYHVSRRTGAVSRDMDRGVMAITSLMRILTFQLLGMFIGVFGVAGIMVAFFDWSYAVIILAAAVFYAVYTVKVTAWRTPFIRQSNEANSRANTRAIDSLINDETVKTFAKLN